MSFKKWISSLLPALCAALLLAACGSSKGPTGEADQGPRADAAAQRDGHAQDSGPLPDLGPAPDLDPNGKLIYEQLGLAATMGESALLIGPDGTSVLIDTGNGLHAAEVAASVTRLTGGPAVDWVVLTHFHADHMGGVKALFGAGGRLAIRKGIITRGLFDIDVDQLAENDVDSLCRALSAEPLSSLHRPLCEGAAPAVCGSTSGAPWPAASCDGLLRGDLARDDDDGRGLLSYIDLGGGARLYFQHANTRVGTSSGVRSASEAGLNIGHGGTHPENGRSVGGVIRWGDFAMVFSGDLTAEMEAVVATLGDTIRPSPNDQPLLSGGHADVVELGHHGFASSTSQAWVDWLYPDDGKVRNAVVGATPSYILPPEVAVVDRLAPRLNGGYIWLTAAGMIGVQQHPSIKVAGGAVIVRVDQAGTRYFVTTRSAEGESSPVEYQATP